VAVIYTTNPVYHLLEKQTNVHAQLEKNKQANTEDGEVNLKMKRACLCTRRSGSNLIEEIWCGQKLFEQSIKIRK